MATHVRKENSKKKGAKKDRIREKRMNDICPSRVLRKVGRSATEQLEREQTHNNNNKNKWRYGSYGSLFRTATPIFKRDNARDNALRRLKRQTRFYFSLAQANPGALFRTMVERRILFNSIYLLISRYL